MNGVNVCKSSAPNEDKELVNFAERRVVIEVDLHAGDHGATILTNDLTHDYVHENSAYST